MNLRFPHQELLLQIGTIATGLDDEDTRAHNDKGKALAELGQYEEAIKRYGMAARIDEENVVVYNNKAMIFVELGRYEEATKCCDMAIKIDPRYGVPYISKAKMLEKRDYEKAEKYRRKANSLDYYEAQARPGLKCRFRSCLHHFFAGQKKRPDSGQKTGGKNIVERKMDKNNGCPGTVTALCLSLYAICFYSYCIADTRYHQYSSLCKKRYIH